MKTKLFVLFLLISISKLYSQQNNNPWEKLNYLIGNWEGEGSGKPGEGIGYFSFKMDLDNNILVRISHSEYPASNGKPAINHNDLMIIYRDKNGIPSKAIYFDNENHVINYDLTFPDEKEIVFTSEKVPNIPLFRFTYSLIDDNTVNTKFEISTDGNNFFTYVEGKSKRVK